MAEAAYYRAQSDAAEARRLAKNITLGDKVLNNPALNRTYNTKVREIPIVDLKLCEYDKERKVLKLASEYFGMPRTFFVKSHHTGKEVRFVTVGPEDKLYDEDGWDGEQQIYRPLGNVPGVDHMVIYHAW
jgi:hypothetical protein